MKFTLEIITKMDPIALYAAIVATGVLLWDIVKWFKSGPILKLKCFPGRVMVGGGDFYKDKTFTLIKVTNRGSKTTTINNVGIVWYQNRWKKIINKPTSQGLIPDPKLTQDFPYELAPGAEWSGAIDEGTLDMTMKECGVFVCQMFHSFSDKPVQSEVKYDVKK